jgi:hypothetical protein
VIEFTKGLNIGNWKEMKIWLQILLKENLKMESE